MNKPTTTTPVVETTTQPIELFDSFCNKCNQPRDPSCEICGGTGSALTEVFVDAPDVEQITALHCKYGCNSVTNCKGRCAKDN